MSKIIQNYNNGDEFPAPDANQTFVVTNNILMDVANKNGISIEESNNNALINGLSSLAMCRQNAFDVSGTANAIILTTNTIYSSLTIFKYTPFLRFGFFVAITNTGAVTIQIGNLAALAVVKTNGVAIAAGEFTAGSFVECVYDNINNRMVAVSGITNISNTLLNILPYSVISAKTDSNGYANFIVKVDNETISFDTNSGVTSIEICYPDCSIESHASLDNITGISTNNTWYIVKFKNDVVLTNLTNLYNGTTPNPKNIYYTNLMPVESVTAPTSPAINQLWLDISVSPRVPKRWNGSSWTVTQFVKLGEFVRNSGVIGTPISYALNGQTITSGGTYTGAGTYTQSHNIGSQSIKSSAVAICTTANNGFIQGDIVVLTYSENSGGTAGFNANPGLNRITGSVYLGGFINVTSPTGVGFALNSNFKIAFIVQRTF